MKVDHNTFIVSSTSMFNSMLYDDKSVVYGLIQLKQTLGNIARTQFALTQS